MAAASVAAPGIVLAGVAAPAAAAPGGPARGATPSALPRHNPARTGKAGLGALPVSRPARVALAPSSAYVLVDVNTGNVLAGYNEHERLRPASLTKVLTALIAVSYLPHTARVPGTKQSLHAYPNIVGIEKGVGWPLNEVLQALLVYSANDAAYAIAQRVSGTLKAFGPVMDEAARQIGMSDDPDFHDPAGLDGTEGVGGGNWVSARDLAISGRDLLQVPELARIVHQQSASFVDPTGAAHDLPSMDYTFLVSYPGAIGIKTGFTDSAGECLMAAATRHGRTMLAVVMNGYNDTATAISLLNEGFATRVAQEPTADRLPPASLPKPLVATGRQAQNRAQALTAHDRASARAGGPASSHQPGAASQTGSQTGSQAGDAAPGGPGTLASASRRAGPSHGSSRGLRAVLGTWPAQTLLVLAGLMGLFALWEIFCANRARTRTRLARQYSDRSSVVANLSGDRKRRQDLINSYRRHEHRGAGALRGAPTFGRR